MILQKNVCPGEEPLLKFFMKVVETNKINGFALIQNKSKPRNNAMALLMLC